jgi:hypothetical protein
MQQDVRYVVYRYGRQWYTGYDTRWLVWQSCQWCQWCSAVQCSTVPSLPYHVKSKEAVPQPRSLPPVVTGRLMTRFCRLSLHIIVALYGETRDPQKRTGFEKFLDLLQKPILKSFANKLGLAFHISGVCPFQLNLTQKCIDAITAAGKK